MDHGIGVVSVEHPDPTEEAKFNTEQMRVPPRAQPNDAFVDQATRRRAIERW